MFFFLYAKLLITAKFGSPVELMLHVGLKFRIALTYWNSFILLCERQARIIHETTLGQCCYNIHALCPGGFLTLLHAVNSNNVNYRVEFIELLLV
jgi:predicted GH43/DUF377 family glycosyl hydrolase